MTYHHSTAIVGIGQDHVTISFVSSGRIIWAKIVYAERDGERLVYAMLDRRIHEDHVGYGGYTLTGCFATEVHAPPIDEEEWEE